MLNRCIQWFDQIGDHEIIIAMTKKSWLSLLAVAVLAAVYVIYFTDWFRPKTVEVFHTVRAMRARGPKAAAQKAAPEKVVLFGLNRQLALTEVELVVQSEWQTNRHALPLWHLVSNSNSVPVKSFVYGQMIRGLKPAVLGTRAQPLGTNVVYRLVIKAGPVFAEHVFELK
jgi:hypothetical protein